MVQQITPFIAMYCIVMNCILYSDFVDSTDSDGEGRNPDVQEQGNRELYYCTCCDVKRC